MWVSMCQKWCHYFLHRKITYHYINFHHKNKIIYFISFEHFFSVCMCKGVTKATAYWISKFNALSQNMLYLTLKKACILLLPNWGQKVSIGLSPSFKLNQDATVRKNETRRLESSAVSLSCSIFKALCMLYEAKDDTIWEVQLILSLRKSVGSCLYPIFTHFLGWRKLLKCFDLRDHLLCPRLKSKWKSILDHGQEWKG